MTTPEHILPYGMRDIKITPYTTGETLDTDTYDLPAARTLSYTDSEDFTDLRGDDTVITRRGSGPNVAWTMESGGLRFAVVAAMFGHTLTETGTTPAAVKTLRRTTADVRPFFQAEGQAMSDTGGDVHAILYKCRATEQLEFSMTDGEFYLYNPGGTAFGLVAQRTGPPIIPAGTIYDHIFNETTTAIAAATTGGTVS